MNEEGSGALLADTCQDSRMRTVTAAWASSTLCPTPFPFLATALNPTYDQPITVA